MNFLCSSCGHESAKWYGKCPACGEWNTLNEFTPSKATSKTSLHLLKDAPTVSLKEVTVSADNIMKSGFPELDRVLGGGIVEGSVVLVGGEPGVGKSTLMLQVANSVSQNKNVLYISGEESARQLKLRAQRIKSDSENVYVCGETEVSSIVSKIGEVTPALAVIDSIQTLYSSALSGSAGAVSQIKECAAQLTRCAKETGVPIFLIGHVTKEGSIAGPRILEHMVDTVLYFEGENLNAYRVLRAVKNRFGSTNEISVFEMTGEGMKEVANFGSVFIAQREANVAGSAVYPAIEGTRPVMLEIQALVSKTAFNIPRRVTTGVDFNRTALVLAVLEKKIGLKLFDQDVYVSVVGGIKLSDPAADMAIAAAVVSAYNSKPTGETVIMGEIGLTGQLRAVSQPSRRLSESLRLGFEQAVLPKAGSTIPKDINAFEARNVWDGLNHLFH